MSHKNKKEKDDYVISDMNVEGFSWYRPDKKENIKRNIDFEEKKSINKGFLSEYYKIAISVLLGFIIVFIILWLWISK